jgi:drug/metabolite transporter (DMT)-like permease
MWIALSFLALIMLSVRRSAEKAVSTGINSMAMVWLQQAVALPIIIGTLFFARFYWPSELSAAFWLLMAVYIVTSAVDIYCYFKAISIADISYVAPLLTLFVVGNIAGAYVILGQVPSTSGLIGALLIMAGAYMNNLAKRRQKTNIKQNQLALVLVLVSVILRSFYANIEVIMLRETNPISYNFYTSVLSVPFIILVTWLIVRQRPAKYVNYWSNLKTSTRSHIWPLVFIGVTYTVNILATYQAKLISPNAAYVGAIKSATVLPLLLIGIFMFKEKVTRLQWAGVVLILFGLVALATN